MKIFLIRHGQDDDSVRGGWSNSALTETGLLQSAELADELSYNTKLYNIGRIFSSDILRARQTAEIIAERLGLPVEYLPEFREVNNGDLAGLDNKVAESKYPNMYWRNMDWSEHYPNGESPCDFHNRVNSAWNTFLKSLAGYDKNALLITHGGVINVIRCITEGEKYSNKERYPSVPSAKICFEIEV